MQPKMPPTPTSHGSGARNLRSVSGSRRRSTSIAAHTATNAASVPAFAKAAMLASGMSPANTEVTIAVKMVMRTGVPRRAPGRGGGLTAGRAAAREAERHERVEMAGFDHRQRESDEENHRGALDQDRERVDRCAFAGSGDQQPGEYPDDEDGGKVEAPAE